MFRVLVDTFGKELHVGDEKVGDYLKKSEIRIQSPSLPFKSVEPLICWLMIGQKKRLTRREMAHLGYHMGSADVPCIPIVFIGQAEQVPEEMARLDNVFCVKEENLEAILKPLINTFRKSEEILKVASGARVDERLKLREKLLTEARKAMQAYGYIEEVRGEL